MAYIAYHEGDELVLASAPQELIYLAASGRNALGAIWRTQIERHVE